MEYPHWFKKKKQRAKRGSQQVLLPRNKKSRTKKKSKNLPTTGGLGKKDLHEENPATKNTKNYTISSQPLSTLKKKREQTLRQGGRMNRGYKLMLY